MPFFVTFSQRPFGFVYSLFENNSIRNFRILSIYSRMELFPKSVLVQSKHFLSENDAMKQEKILIRILTWSSVKSSVEWIAIFQSAPIDFVKFPMYIHFEFIYFNRSQRFVILVTIKLTRNSWNCYAAMYVPSSSYFYTSPFSILELYIWLCIKLWIKCFAIFVENFPDDLVPISAWKGSKKCTVQV